MLGKAIGENQQVGGKTQHLCIYINCSKHPFGKMYLLKKKLVLLARSGTGGCWGENTASWTCKPSSEISMDQGRVEGGPCFLHHLAFHFRPGGNMAAAVPVVEAGKSVLVGIQMWGPEPTTHTEAWVPSSSHLLNKEKCVRELHRPASMLHKATLGPLGHIGPACAHGQ